MPPRLKTPPKGRVAPAPEPKGFISGKITKAASARQGSARYSPEPSPRSRSEGRSPKAGSRPAGAQMQKAPSAADRIAARGATDQRRSARTARARAASEETSLGRLARRLARRLRRVPVVITLPEARKMTAALGLSARHLRHLRSGFDDIDVDGSGNIDPSEFFGALKEAASPLTDQLFRLMDMDGDASISFDEYVCVALAYSTYTQDDILKFCFDTFDLDGSGSIDEREFVLLARSVNNGDPLFSGNFKTALQNIDLNDDGLIDFDELKELNRRFPLLFYPAFRMQASMQKLTLGETEWVNILANVQWWARRRHQRHGEPKSSCERIAEMLGLGAHAQVDLDYLDTKAKIQRAYDAAAASSKASDKEKKEDRPKRTGRRPEAAE